MSRTASDDVGIEMLRVVLFPYFASVLISQKPKVPVLGKQNHRICSGERCMCHLRLPKDASALAVWVPMRSDIHTIIAFLHCRMRLAILLNSKFQASTASIATEQHPSSCSQHGEPSMIWRNISKLSSNSGFNIKRLFAPSFCVQPSVVLRPNTVSCCCCSARPQISKTESNRDVIVMQDRSLSGTASVEEGMKIHRVVLLCFLASMLMLEGERTGVSGIVVDCPMKDGAHREYRDRMWLS